MVAEISVQLPTGSAKMTSGCMRAQFSHDAKQIRKLAAKTSARHFTGLHSVVRGVASIDQVVPLIVQYYSTANATAFQLFCGCQDQRGFPSA